jgi:hypothetical protein
MSFPAVSISENVTPARLAMSGVKTSLIAAATRAWLSSDIKTRSLICTKLAIGRLGMQPSPRQSSISLLISDVPLAPRNTRAGCGNEQVAELNVPN